MTDHEAALVHHADPSAWPTHGMSEATDGISIEDVVRDHYRDVYRYAFRLTGNEADAADICQQTFLTAQRKLHQVRDSAKVNRWLFSITRTSFLKSRRRRRPQTGVEMPVQAIGDRGPDAWIDQERLQSALDELSDEFRLVVTMYYFENLSYREIADALQLPMGTVMSRLSRAKGRLRQKLLVENEPDTESSPSDAQRGRRHA